MGIRDMYAKAYKKVTGKAPTTDIRKVQEKRAYEEAYHQAKIQAIKAKAQSKAKADVKGGGGFGGMLGGLASATALELGNFAPQTTTRRRKRRSRSFQEEYFL